MNFSLLLPEWIALGTLVILILREILTGTKTRDSSGVLIPLVGLVLVFIAVLSLRDSTQSAFGGTFVLDSLAVFFKLFLSLTAFVVIASGEFFFRPLVRREKITEFFLILWCAFLGMLFLVSANDFLILFIALEIMTLSFYILTAYQKENLASIEASIKYLILGSLASAFIIFGISLFYVAAGSTRFEDIQTAFAAQPSSKLLLLAVLLILSGLGFKVAAVPFQLWAPDVYEGAPVPVVAFLSVGSKAAGFALLLRLTLTVFTPFDTERKLLFAVLAAMTMIYGTLGAVVQKNIKRLLGYSSIAHAGYLLIGLAAARDSGPQALLYYLITYALANLTIFLVLSLAASEIKSDQIDAYRGLSKRSPLLAGSLFVALLSLAGAPPLAGFVGKFLMLWAAVRDHLGWLALIGILSIPVSLYFYLGIIRSMYIEEPVHGTPIRAPYPAKLLLGLLISGILLAGFFQTPFFFIVENALRSLS